ncbi:aminotransferase-like domain-containing protein [Gluconacetobacter diazotrophicus]|uniref:aminotransferase-like domain-containing protein n=1 Tax=Gluconacetobacter diazotrophicus TaxID=33996 RepID=UPI0011A73353|nr:PLP-dependent aminotransferase family protein [Gluconacetobacter diazotrophicus]
MEFAVAWCPRLPTGPGPLYDRLADAIQQDIVSGKLDVGSKLPPHRDLAHALGVSVGTIAKGYAEAERRGLVNAHVGRGSFIRSTLRGGSIPPRMPSLRPAGTRTGVIDLRCNTPPPVALSDALQDSLGALSLYEGLEAAVRYIQGSGLRSIRTVAADWLRRRHGIDSPADDLVQCNGGQHGIALVFSAVARPGDTILCESSTFYGARVAAEQLGLRLRGVSMDAEGMMPDALERAILESRSKLLFTIPTLHNPTTRTLGRNRREEIARIARQHDVTIFEDDAYHAYADAQERPPPIATFAPERTFYLASISKGLCPGLRLAFLVLPAGLGSEQIMRAVRALGYCPPALGGLIFSRWVENGTADRIAAEVQRECAVRLNIARSILGPHIAAPGAARTPHLWLPMPALDAERVVARALRADVEITPPDVSTVSGDADTGIRLCLGATESSEALESALTAVRTAIEGDERRRNEGII